MIILAIDTATAATTVALLGPGVSNSRTLVDAYGHVESLAPLIDEVLGEAGTNASRIDVVACGVGPGPFTGLRVGIATALSMGTVLQRPVVGVCTHDALARASAMAAGGSVDRGEDSDAGILVATSARRAECHVSRYDGNGVRVTGPIVASHDETRAWIADSEFVVAGDAGPALVSTLEASRCGPKYPDAADLAAIVQERHQAGENWPEDDAHDVDLDPAAARGASTADYLDRRQRAGLLLLPARPLYLRQPDAVPTAQRPGASGVTR